MKTKQLKILQQVSCILFSLMLFQHSFAQSPDWSLLTPELSGTLKLGIINGEESKWLSDFSQVKEKNNPQEITYTAKDKIIEKGKIELIIRPLMDSKGAIMKLNFIDIPENAKLVWTYGGASNQKVDTNNWKPNIIPEDCYQNVFSIEGNSFTLYYGTSRSLKILEALTPSGSPLRLSDAHQQETPLALLLSGKKSTTQVLSADVDIQQSESLYFCFYFLNPKADYNYFMLPKLFEKGSYRVNKETEWMKSTPD